MLQSQSIAGAISRIAIADGPARNVLCAALMAIAYFAGARLGLAFQTQPEGVAVFWPPAGIAAGALVLLGSWARGAIVLGVVVGTMAANLMGDRNLPLALGFGVCNAIEALLFSWIVQEGGDKPNALESLGAAIRFFVATAAASAFAAVNALLVIRIAGSSTAANGQLWLAWWESDVIGIVMFAPLFIAAAAEHQRATRRENIEGLTVLGTLLLVTYFSYFASPGSAVWHGPVPVALMFPLLLWVAARCPPIYLAAALTLIAMMVVSAATQGLGHFGNAALPLADRILSARLTLLSIAFCSLVLVAVFTERRLAIEDLRARDQRFASLVATSPGMIATLKISPDGQRSVPFASNAIGTICGLRAVDLKDDATAMFAAIHPDDLQHVEQAVAGSIAGMAPHLIEFRYRHPERGEVWLESHAAPLLESDGSVLLHGNIRDITIRKRALARIEFLMGDLDHRVKNLLNVVQAVAMSTARESEPAEFAEAFSNRIQALAASYKLLRTDLDDGVDVGDLVRSQLAHLEGLIGSRIFITGEGLRLRPGAMEVIGMALHELATNAGKYGALSTDRGEVHIRWSSDATTFHFSWVERHGPPPRPPNRRGFGHKVLISMAEHQIDADVSLAYPATGLEWHAAAPLARVREGCA